MQFPEALEDNPLRKINLSVKKIFFTFFGLCIQDWHILAQNLDAFTVMMSPDVFSN
jgi:hypothetical protein